MSEKDKIISLSKMLENSAYQAMLNEKSKKILGDNQEVDTKTFLESDKFKSIFTLDENIDLNKIKLSIEQLVGKKLTHKELNLLLVLMDADLENIQTETGEIKEKFVMDSVFHVDEGNGLLEATPSEVSKIKTRSRVFQESNLPVAEKLENGNYRLVYEDGSVLLEFTEDMKTVKFPNLFLFLKKFFQK